MRARVTVRLKPSVLDPQGEAIERALVGLGLHSAKNVRVGKCIELDVDDGPDVEQRLKAVADALLANPVIEDYRVELNVVADSKRAG